jgi:hypothetical protein
MSRLSSLACLILTTLTALSLARWGVVAAQATESPPLELVGHLSMAGPSGNLYAHKNTAYMGTWTGAKVGVRLIDIGNPAHPTLLTTLPVRRGAVCNDLKALGADTLAFRGDLLAVGETGGVYGVEFWDVTDPRRPRFLSSFSTGGDGVYGVSLLQRQGQVLALLATLDRGLQIVDATNPGQPLLLATWQLQAQLGINPGVGARGESFNRGVSTNGAGTIAYLAYGDAGVVILDISDPVRPRYLGRTRYYLDEEGGALAAAEAKGGQLLITTDFDLDPAPTARSLHVIEPVKLAGLHPGAELACTRPLAQTGPIRALVVYIGTGLTSEPLLADPQGKIALLQPGNSEATVRGQISRAQAAGAVAVLLSRPVGNPLRCSTPSAIPGMSLSKESAHAIQAALKKGETVEVELVAGASTWGFVWLWDIRNPTWPRRVGRFATPATRQFPPRQGWFTAYRPVVRGNRLYVSWCTDGVRVVDIADPERPREIAHFIPPNLGAASPYPQPGTPGPYGAFPMTWGATEHHGLILVSDMRTGLWILRDLPA